MFLQSAEGAYNRYILRQLWRTGWVVLASLFMVLWFSQSIRFIELVVNRGLPFYTVLILSLQWLPSLLIILLPVSQMITMLLVMQRMIADHEWVVWNAIGTPPRTLLRPFLKFGLAGTIVLGLSNIFLLPISYNSFRDYQDRLRDSVLSLQEGTFTNALPNITVFVRQQTSSSKFSGLLIQDTRSAQETDTIYASRGELLRTPQGVILRIFDGTRQTLNLASKELTLLSFAEYQLNLSATLSGGGAGKGSGNMTGRNGDAKGLSTWSLLSTDSSIVTMANQLRAYRAEAHQRIVGSFFPLCLTLLMYFGLTQDLRTRSNRAQILLRVGGLGALFMAMGYGLNALNLRNNQWIWLSYGLVVGTLYGCYRWHKARIAGRSLFARTNRQTIRRTHSPSLLRELP
ncbi:MAG: LptF/LptG family permease [Alphaproteobacteria bacterium]|nr:LptF/LptG family permease [Alphaproteobacteria bacterium]